MSIKQNPFVSVSNSYILSFHFMDRIQGNFKDFIKKTGRGTENLGIFYGELKDQEEVELFSFMQTDSCGNFRQFCRDFTGNGGQIGETVFRQFEIEDKFIRPDIQSHNKFHEFPSQNFFDFPLDRILFSNASYQCFYEIFNITFSHRKPFLPPASSVYQSSISFNCLLTVRIFSTSCSVNSRK